MATNRYMGNTKPSNRVTKQSTFFNSRNENKRKKYNTVIGVEYVITTPDFEQISAYIK